MAVYGKLTAASEEALAAEIAEEKRTTNGVYGPLVIDGQPGGAEATPLEESPLGADYTLAELMAAIEGDPALAKELALTELKRPQGPRKTALRYFAEMESLDEDTKKLAAEALAIFDKPAE